MDIDIEKINSTLLSNFVLNTIENEALANIKVEDENLIYLPDGDLNKTFNNINDSNYVSEESVTLTDRSIDKYDDSLEYQADDLNSDSINVDNVESDVNNDMLESNSPLNEDDIVGNEVLGENHFDSESTLYEEFSINDEIDNDTEQEDKIEIKSDIIEMLSDSSFEIENNLVAPKFQDQIELKNEDFNEIETYENEDVCEEIGTQKLKSEVELHNNAYIYEYSVENTQGNTIIRNESEKSTDTNVAVCVSQEIESTNYIAPSINSSEMTVSLTSDLDLNENKQSTNQIQSSINDSEMKNISFDMDLNEINPTNQNRSFTKSAEMSNNSSEMDNMDLNEQDFTSCSWLYSVSSISKNERFDIELLSFDKMNLIASQFNNSSSLLMKLNWDGGKANNSHRYSQNRSIAQHVSPISVAKSSIVTSTPMAFKSRNTAKEAENLSKLHFSDPKDSVKPFKNPFTVEDNSTEIVNPGLDIVTSPVPLSIKPVARVPNLNETLVIGNNQSVTVPKITYKPEFSNGKVSPTLGFMLDKSKKPHGSLTSVIPRVNQPRDSSDNHDKPTKSDSESSLLRKPAEVPKSKMMPPSLKPPSRIVQKKLPPKETAPPPPIDPNLARRHSSVGENESAVPKKTSRPTSLMKPPLGLSRISKSFRSTLAVPTIDTTGNAAPSVSSSLVDTGVPKSGPLLKKSRIQRMSKAPVQNENARTAKCDTEQPTGPIISTPIQCDNPPIISPSVNVPSNPLNRTFDREQFQLLKSFTNSSGNNNDDRDNGDGDDRSEASSSTLRSNTPDSDGNNNSISRNTMGGIYQLAKREEDNLKKHVNSTLMRQATAGAYRSLKLPSQIRPRALIPTVERK